TGPLLDHLGQGVGDVMCDVLVDRALLLRLGLVDDPALPVPDLAYHMIWHCDSVIGERRVRAGLRERADFGGPERNAVVVVPAGALGSANGLGHPHDLPRPA